MRAVKKLPRPIPDTTRTADGVDRTFRNVEQLIEENGPDALPTQPKEGNRVPVGRAQAVGIEYEDSFVNGPEQLGIGVDAQCLSIFGGLIEESVLNLIDGQFDKIKGVSSSS